MTAILISMQNYRAGRTLAQRANDVVSIARRFAAARLAAGMRPVELSASTGVAENTLSQWEGAERRPSLDQVSLVLPVLRITLDWLYYGDESGLNYQVREALLEQLEKVPDPQPKAERIPRRSQTKRVTSGD